MAIYRRKIFAVAAKIETTRLTDSVPTLAADALRIAGMPTLTITTIESGDRGDVQHGGLGKLGRNIPIGRTGTIELRIEALAKGSAYLAATDFVHGDVLLRGSGLTKTFAAATLTYTTADTGFESFSMYCYAANGKLFKLVGCVANWKLEARVGQPWYYVFSVTGRLESVTEASITGLVLPVGGGGAASWSSTLVSIGTWTSALAEPATLWPQSLDIDAGNVIAPVPAAGQTGGNAGSVITDRAMKASMQVHAVAAATFDPYGNAGSEAPTAAASKIVTSVSGFGNTIGVETGAWALAYPGETDINGLAGWSLEGDLVAKSATNGREILLTYV